MECGLTTDALIPCGTYHGVITGAMAFTGAIAAPIALTAVTVGSVAMTVGLFAAPALLVGVGMTALFTFLPDMKNHLNFGKEGDKSPIILWIQAAAFALVSSATITAGVLLGALTTPLMITFIVASAIVTLAMAALGVGTHLGWLT